MSVESTDSEVITIVEGPTPDFHMATEPWALSLLEASSGYIAATCQVRSFNGEKLMERCRRAWRKRQSIRLDFKDMAGLRQQLEIIAAHLDKVDNVDVLNLWVRERAHSLIGGRGEGDSPSAGPES